MRTGQTWPCVLGHDGTWGCSSVRNGPAAGLACRVGSVHRVGFAHGRASMQAQVTALDRTCRLTPHLRMRKKIKWCEHQGLKGQKQQAKR